MSEGTGRIPSHAEATRILAERDPVIARLLAETGPPRFGRPTETHFETLVRAIVYQQLAGRAAAAIHGRLMAAVGGDMRPETLITPAGRLAGRRPGRPPRLRAGLADPHADRARAQAARRPVPALPVGGGLVLLAGRRAVRGRGRERADR